jgi:HlyD family secretion protein
MHGYLKGRLMFVSEESNAINEGGGESSNPSLLGKAQPEAVHRGRVELETTTLEHMPPGARLIPGMTVSAEVKVGARRVISFFLSPLTKGLTESLREP